MRVAVIVCVLSATAHADPCTDARTALRAGDLTRASIVQAGCEDPGVGDAIDRAARLRHFAHVTVSTEPGGGTVAVEPAPDAPFTAPRAVWLAPGTWTVTASVDGQPVAQTIVVARDDDEGYATVDVPPPASPAQVVDLGDDGGPDVVRGSPADVKFGSLLPDRFQRGLDAKTPVLWSEPWPRRRFDHWRAAAGPVAGRVLDGGTGTFGGALALSYRARLARLWDGDLALAPAASLFVLDAAHLGGRGDLVVADDFTLIAPRWHLGAGVGATVVFDGDTSAGAVAIAELSRRHLSLALRADLPLASTGARIATAALLVGRRW